MTKRALWERPVNYGAIGATQAADLLQYPPAGYRPIERRVRLGHGDARWEFAYTQALSWGIQRLSGMRVDVADTPATVTEATYSPVSFDAAGEPVAPAALGAGGDATFAPDGTAFVVPGESAKLRIPFGPFRVTAPVRVVYVVDENDRKGFGYGTLPGHPERGEEAWIIDRQSDGTVWMTIRAFSRPATFWWWLVYPVLRVSQSVYTRRYERALSGSLTAG